MVGVHLDGSPEEVDLALIRLRQAFSEVEVPADEPTELQPRPNQVHVFAIAHF